jgi:hypothetical protein
MKDSNSAAEQSVDGDRPPFVTFADTNRGRSIKFREVFGQHALYHVVSMTPFTEAHFDERDPDSEDEIDHSWRLRMQEQDVNALPVSAKHKVLWTMWNRHVFQSGAAGSYGYRFTRHEVELFAIDMRHDIQRLGLRVHFVAFLRALHVHGHIDAEAVLSAVQCLDHRKKRRACNETRRAKKAKTLVSRSADA